MAPGPAATRRFAALYPYPGAWSAVSTLEMLSACPPTADRTGPDGEALRRVPLTVDVVAELTGCYGSHGPSAPFGPAAFGRTSLAMARLMISHAHGTAIYGRDPALKSEEEEEDEEDDELVGFDQKASSAMRALKAAAAAAAAAAVVPRKGGVSAVAGRASAAKGCSTCIAEEQQKQYENPDAGGSGESDYSAEAGGGSRAAGADARPGRLEHDALLRDERTAKMLSILAEEMTGPVLPPPPPLEGTGSGEKRKARAAPVQYDLADIRQGKGTPADAVSFFELAEGATAPVAALSFYQVRLC